MTKKRFKKLLMADGFSRNSAQHITQSVPASGMSYQEAYTGFYKGPYKEAINSIIEAIPKIIDAVKRVADTLNSGIKAFTEAYTNAING